MTGSESETSYADAPVSAFFTLPDALVFEVTGRDATRYLNARLTNDVKALPIGRACLAAALTAQGKTQGLFRVLRLEESRYLLVADGGDPEKVLAAVKKFIVADRVEVRDLRGEAVLAHAYGPAKPLERTVGIRLPDEADFADAGGIRAYRATRLAEGGYDLLAAPGKLQEIAGELEPAGFVRLTPAQADAYRIRYARPAFPVEIGEERLFLEAGVREAISFDKGCYVGQEVVEKIESHGKLPRKLHGIVVEGTPGIEAGAEVGSEAGTIGTVLSRAEIGDRTYCLATIKSDQASPGREVTVGGTKGVLE